MFFSPSAALFAEVDEEAYISTNCFLRSISDKAERVQDPLLAMKTDHTHVIRDVPKWPAD